MEHANVTAAEALEKLKEGNQRYLDAKTNPGDISANIRKKTCEHFFRGNWRVVCHSCGRKCYGQTSARKR